MLNARKEASAEFPQIVFEDKIIDTCACSS
jgi:hypothetical protein